MRSPCDSGANNKLVGRYGMIGILDYWVLELREVRASLLFRRALNLTPSDLNALALALPSTIESREFFACIRNS